MILRISSDTTLPDFFVDHYLKNAPAVFPAEFTQHWLSRDKWVDSDGKPNWDYLEEHHGDMEVPLLVGENHCDYEKVTLREFISTYIRERSGTAYVKDWHFQRELNGPTVYEPPSFFRYDWVNTEEWTSEQDNVFGGDYRFVYIGTKDSWTKFHCDVMGSYSWSANICGRKRWLMLRPGKEQVFRRGSDFCEDIRQHPELWTEAEVLDFVQEAGEIVFVPSGWYHQVHNLEDAISINHNVINACNLDFVVRLVEERMKDVKNEIDDVREVYTSEEFSEQCQLILRSDLRINVPLLERLAKLVIDSRSNFVASAGYEVACANAAKERLTKVK
ncbi:Protein JMJD-4 a [Aphelenchoides avenae]|nr:Protein JMJD-4 a [Aphelenchus avenae]